MNTILYNAWQWLWLLLIAACLSACSATDDVIQSIDQGQSEYTLSLTIPKPERLTRAGNPTEDGDPTYLESQIDTDKLSVYLFRPVSDNDGDAVCLEQVKDLQVDASSTGTYQVTGKISQMYDGAMKIAVFANIVPTISPNTKLSEACKAQSSLFTIEQSGSELYSPSADMLIPMFGIKSYDADTWNGAWTKKATNGTEINLNTAGQIDLIRAIAKVRVRCSAENFRLSSVSLHNYNTQGYAAPVGMYANTFNPNADEGLFNLSKPEEEAKYGNIPSQKVVTTSLTQTEGRTETLWDNRGTAENCFVFYIPEYKNIGVETPAYLTVKVQSRDGETWRDFNLTGRNKLEFKTYSSGKPADEQYDILRNHLYDFNIKKIGDEVYIEYKVLPWELGTSAIGWNPPTFSLVPHINDMGGGEIDLDDEAEYGFLCNVKLIGDNTKLKNESQNAYFDFSLKGPEGLVWKAFLLDKNGNELTTDDALCFDLGVIKNSNPRQKYVSTGIAREAIYRINITSRKPWIKWSAPDENGFYPNDGKMFTNFTTWGKEFFGVNADGSVNYAEKKKDVPEAYLYIRVSLDGVKWYDLDINPEDRHGRFVDLKSGNKRRKYPGEKNYIWFRQLPNEYGTNFYDRINNDYMNPESQAYKNGFWWRVNPYWVGDPK